MGATSTSMNFTGAKPSTEEETSGMAVVRPALRHSGCQHFCTAGPIKPLPDKYALATDS